MFWKNKMKHRKIFMLIILLIFTQLNLFAQTLQIRLVFESGFSTSFQSGKPWQNVDQQAVKDNIVSRVTAAYAPYNIPVSQNTGNIIAYIGGSNNLLHGIAITGLGSYHTAINNGPTAECYIYSNNFSIYSQFQGTNANVTKIARVIARTVIHELGHLLNLYHAYMYDSFDPASTLSGTLNSMGYPNEPGTLHSNLKTDPNASKHFMHTGNIDMNQYATEEAYFSDNSDQALRFGRDAGGYVTKNMIWGVPNGQFYLTQ